jgi:hypothetical protein
MKKLFPVPLLGKDTPEVESLPSYIARLAYHHKVSVGDILRLAFLEIKDMAKVKKNHFGPEAIMQPNNTTMSLVNILSLMTNQPLEQSALVWMYRSLGRSSLELIKGYRWCPECFSEMNKMGIDPFIKSKWHLSGIKHCPIHKTNFIDKCESCGCKQVGYNRKYKFSLCQDCKADLSERNEPLNPSTIHCSWEENGFDLIKLYSDLVEVRFSSFPEYGAVQSLKDVFDYYWKNDEEYKFYQIFGRDESLGLIHKQQPISLLTARRMALKLGVSLYSFMNGEAAKVPFIIDPKFMCVLPEGYTASIKRRNYDHEEKLKVILCYLEGHEFPSLKKVAECTGTSSGYIRHRYPVLAHKISDEFMEHQQKLRLRKIHLAQKAALEYFFDQKYADHSKSKRQAYKEVKRETGLAKGVIEQAVKRAYDATH